MKQILIHIGIGKTGTTSIQNSWNQAFSKGRTANVEYPIFSELNFNKDQNYLSIVYKDYQDQPRGYKTRFKSEADFIETKKELRTKFLKTLEDSENLFISGEFLENFNDQHVLQLKNDLLNNQYNKIGVLVYFREVFSYFSSLLQQKLKASHIVINPHDFRYNFKRKISIWSSHFPQSVIVEKFPPTNANYIEHHNSIVNDFFKVKVQLQNEDVLNESLSIEEMHILQKFRETYFTNQDNIFLPESNKLLKIFGELKKKSKLSGTKPVLKVAVKNVIYQNHKSDLEWIRSEYGINLLDEQFAPNQEDKLPDFTKVELSDLFENYNQHKILETHTRFLYFILLKIQVLEKKLINNSKILS